MANFLKIFSLFLVLALAGCSGSNNASDPGSPPLTPLPNFNAPESEELAALVENTFTANGNNISVDPQLIDFNAGQELELNDDVEIPFTISNRSGADKSFKLQIYAVSTGFSLLAEDKRNLGRWQEISIAHGGSKTFTARFDAWKFGAQTSFITISSANTAGYIKIPMRAAVAGAANFRLINPGYLCSDKSAPRVTQLDFLKVAAGQSAIQGLKLCNTGGEDITVHEAKILKLEKNIYSRAVQENAFEEFLWEVQDSINGSLALGITPEYTEEFQEPLLTSYLGSLSDPVGDFHVAVDGSSRDPKDTLVPAGGLVKFNIDFSPTLDIEAEAGRLFEAIPRGARLRLKTSLGTVDIPLLGATGGHEPVLKLSYRQPGEDLWKTVDLSSNGPAVYFGTVEVFKDWITDNYSVVEFKVENAGTGNQPLLFFPQSVAGYFEYDLIDGQEPGFPLNLPPGSAPQYFALRYMPTPAKVGKRKRWDMGQFYFAHNGGNGPHGKLSLVGERETGHAVEVKMGGTDLERNQPNITPAEKNLCVFKIDDGTIGTAKTFTVVNNNKKLPLSVSWNITDDGTFTATPGSGTLTVDPASSQNFVVDFLARSSTSEGQSLGGSLSLSADFATASGILLEGKESRDFTMPFQALASSSGECVLGGGKVIGSGADGNTPVTMILDRITMILTSLAEPTRNPPAFKTHLPIDLNHKDGTIRVTKKIDFIYDKNAPEFDPIKQIRSYAHQISHTNAGGCSTLPTNPYRLEYQKGSWTGPGFDCNGNGNITISGSKGSFTVDTDTACLPTNGGEEVTDENGVKWVVFYHEFVKFDTQSCLPDYYGKIATFAYQKDSQSFSDLFASATANPNESEAYYENLFGAFKFGSYVVFTTSGVSCGARMYNSGDIIDDPDAVRDCYFSIAEKDDATRRQGLLNECSYFNFSIDAGIIPEPGNTDTSTWQGFGTYEPHVDDEGNVHPTKYDMTLHNVHAKIFILSPGDRFSFFSHAGKLLYTDIYFTLTTRRLAENDCPDCDPFANIALKTRPQFSLDQIFLKDEQPVDIDEYWRSDGINSEFSNVIDDGDLPRGVNLGGYGKGAFRHCKNPSQCDVIPAGWPVNFDENNLFTMVGTGSFNGKGGTAPGFAREDASGKGKALYFTFHGCLVEGDPSPSQGCYSYKRDDLASSDGTAIIDEYKQRGMLPDGYPEDSGECATFFDTGHLNPASPDFNPYLYMSCINFKIFPQDRDRLTNYYDSDKFHYQKDYYGSSTCGFGM